MNGAIQNKRYYPQSAFMKSMIECYQWIEVDGSFSLRTVPNGRVDGWLILDGGFDFVDSQIETITPAPVCGFFPLSENGKELRIEKKIKTLNLKFLPHVLSFKPMMKLQQLAGPVSFSDLFNPAMVQSLATRIDLAANTGDIVDIIENFFEAAFLSESDENNWLKSILEYVGTLPQDEITVSKLAKAAHVSVKTMERRFLQNIGINPKEFCKIIRFQNAVKEIQNKKNSNNTKRPSVSLTSGYYDQSHFGKDAKHFTGHSPKKMLLYFAPETSDIILQQG